MAATADTRTELALVRELYASWARGEIDRMEALVTDDFLWVEHPAAPDARLHRGRAEWAASRRAYADVWERIVITPFRYLVSPPKVLAVVRYELRGHGGVPISATTGHLITLRDGALAELHMLDRDESLARLGADAARLHANARAVAARLAPGEVAAQRDRVAATMPDGTALLCTLRDGTIMRAEPLPGYGAALAGLAR